MILWEQIADEWLNRGWHHETLPNGDDHLWYDGVVYTMEFNQPLIFPFEKAYIVQSDPGEFRIEPMESPQNEAPYPEVILCQNGKYWVNPELTGGWVTVNVQNAK